MKTQTRAPTTAELDPIFHRYEQAFLFDYFELPRPLALQVIELEVDYDEDQGDEDVHPETGGIRVRTSADGHCDKGDIENAVARLLLAPVQGTLPQWAVIHGGGDIETARHVGDYKQRPVATLPQGLCSINWADSGPGFSWPDYYHVTYVPGFHRFVVTHSVDSREGWGYEDLPIDHFDADEDMHDNCVRIVAHFWQYQKNGWDQAQWEELSGCGVLSGDDIEQIAAKVWPQGTEWELA